MRTTFDQELQHLQDRLLALGSQVGDNIVRSVIALYERDAIAARRLIEGDKEVNRKRIEIMTDTLILIARQQPMA
ncbi:MAG: PhoU domain-containing protein, partial [Chloroflexota bacterium]